MDSMPESEEVEDPLAKLMSFNRKESLDIIVLIDDDYQSEDEVVPSTLNKKQSKGIEETTTLIEEDSVNIPRKRHFIEISENRKLEPEPKKIILNEKINTQSTQEKKILTNENIDTQNQRNDKTGDYDIFLNNKENINGKSESQLEKFLISEENQKQSAQTKVLLTRENIDLQNENKNKTGDYDILLNNLLEEFGIELDGNKELGKSDSNDKTNCNKDVNNDMLNINNNNINSVNTQLTNSTATSSTVIETNQMEHAPFSNLEISLLELIVDSILLIIPALNEYVLTRNKNPNDHNHLNNLLKKMESTKYKCFHFSYAAIQSVLIPRKKQLEEIQLLCERIIQKRKIVGNFFVKEILLDMITFAEVIKNKIDKSLYYLTAKHTEYKELTTLLNKKQSLPSTSLSDQNGVIATNSSIGAKVVSNLSNTNDLRSRYSSSKINCKKRTHNESNNSNPSQREQAHRNGNENQNSQFYFNDTFQSEYGPVTISTIPVQAQTRNDRNVQKQISKKPPSYIDSIRDSRQSMEQQRNISNKQNQLFLSCPIIQYNIENQRALQLMGQQNNISNTQNHSVQQSPATQYDIGSLGAQQSIEQQSNNTTQNHSVLQSPATQYNRSLGALQSMEQQTITTQNHLILQSPAIQYNIGSQSARQSMEQQSNISNTQNHPVLQSPTTHYNIESQKARQSMEQQRNITTQNQLVSLIPETQYNIESQRVRIEQQRFSVDSGFMSPATEVDTELMEAPTESYEANISKTNISNGVIGNCQVCCTATIMQCISCLRVFYCNRRCQEIDWQFHKLVCHKMRRT